MKFYFTFGTDKQFPYQGGWVKVVANSRGEACEKFRTRFPYRNYNTINCAFIYSEDAFSKTIMAQGGGCLGEYCHEVIE